MWSTKTAQLTSNSIDSDCLKIEFTDENNISLLNTYPLTDSEAEKLTPYTFTIKNTCNNSITYDVILEIMNDENRLASKYIALQIDDKPKNLLSNYPEATPTYSDKTYTAVEARNIKSAVLGGGESITYSIKLWMDESVTIEDDAMNKIFASKISVVASPGYPLLATTIVDLAKYDTTNLAYDGTDDNNIRYIGADPDNYLCFDKKCTTGKWRIIGVMNNIETEKNGTQSLVKIIRAESIGEYAWNTNRVNDWTTSTLQTNLNSGDLYTTYIKNYDDLFEIVTWSLGGVSTSELTTAVSSKYYEFERGIKVYTGRPTTWSGKIGLMYPSDYGYATSGGGTTDRATCLATPLISWNSTDSDVSDCKNNDYLYLKFDECTLTPNSGYGLNVLNVYSAGNVNFFYYVSYFSAVRPVGYLRSSTIILNGTGSSSSPWIIAD